MCLESIYEADEPLKGYLRLRVVTFPPKVTQDIAYWGYLFSEPVATGYITSGSNIT